MKEIVKRKYKYIYFTPQMFNNEDIFAGTKKAVDLAQNNLNKIVRWYNKNKYYNDISYKRSQNEIEVKFPIDFNDSYETLTDIDKDGNYQLEGYFIAPKI